MDNFLLLCWVYIEAVANQDPQSPVNQMTELTVSLRVQLLFQQLLDGHCTAG